MKDADELLTTFHQEKRLFYYRKNRSFLSFYLKEALLGWNERVNE